jgi:release factor glutamine methyltransferase
MTLTWREAVDEVTDLDAGDVRWIGREATGRSATEWLLGLDDAVTERQIAAFDRMIGRRRTGEPLQYVLGSWGFRTLDVMVDRRVLIPRPETEWVVEQAIAVARSLARPLIAVDLGTGSGVIALSLASELGDDLSVVATDVSADALDVARANLAGIASSAAARITLLQGAWLRALPDELRGEIGLIVSNPPYVATTDEVGAEVCEWEPHQALFAGADGLDALLVILGEATEWLRPDGAIVCEIGAAQGPAVTDLAVAAGLTDVRVGLDLTGRDRVLVARAPSSPR